MSILDTFYILFQTDAKNATDDLKDLDKAADDVADGLQKADAAGEGLGASLANIAGPAAIAAAAIAAIGFAVNTVFTRIGEVGEIGDAAFKLRSTAQDYDALTRSIRASGGEMAAAQANLAAFSDKLNDAAARPDGPNAKNFEKWGIKFRDINGEAVGAVDGVLALAKSLEGISSAEQMGRLRRLGITDADTVQFLLQGKQAILDKMEAERRAGVVTDRLIDLEGQYQSAVGETRNMLDSLANALTEAVLPALIGAYKAFNSALGWLMEHKTLVEGFFIAVSTVVTAVYLPAMVRAAAATIAATWPFLAIAAAVIAVGAAFALAYEDVRAFLDGQPSLIGELVKRYEWFASFVKGIGAAFQALKRGAEVAFSGVSAAFSAVKSAGAATWSALQTAFAVFVDGVKSYGAFLKEIWGSYKPIWDALKEVVQAVGGLVSALGTRLASDLAPAFDRIGSAFRTIGNAASEVFNAIFGDLDKMFGAVEEAASAIKSGFTSAFNAVMSVWNSTIGLIAGKISGIAQSIRELTGIIQDAPSGGPTVVDENGKTPANKIGEMLTPMNDNAPPGVKNARRMLGNASAAPISGQTAQTIVGTAGNRNVNNTVEVGQVVVNTQAMDGRAIAKEVRGALQQQLRTVSAQFDDGVQK